MPSTKSTILRVLRNLSLAALAAWPLAAAAEVEVDAGTFGGLRARAIGPAVMSGRIAAVDAVAADPLTVYVGAASGGVWKSTDAAVNFKPVFDDHPQSIGAVAIDPSSPEVVWVGTGESWARNSVSVGFGVYKSADGGETWKHVGLADSERIGAVRVDPTNGDVVYVCATGHLWDAGGERGVYKTADGGETWERVLYVDADTGCADLDVDPQEPRILYAAMWQFRRYPDFFESGGPGSGLYRSTDAGATWTRLEDGLPAGDLGRIAVAVAPSRPSVVYATVESEDTALYRSDNLGESWRRLNASTNVTMRPFYFSELVVDPTDHQRVYKPGFMLTYSTDGGESFTGLFGGGFSLGGVHPDHHALWINPANPHEMLLGTDGGLYVSQDRAVGWRHVGTLPVSQLYHVSHDNQWPYQVYGGLQDNNSWMGPSRASGGIANRDWEVIGSGDGFWVFADPTDPNVIYSEYQGGQLLRVDRALGEAKRIKPYPEEGQADLRFNWNAPIHLSPNDPGTIYYGSQFLHRSRDRGDSWQTISPDLTTDDPARQRQMQSGGLTIDNSTAENNATIYAISESPRDPDVIWVGTDDGLVQVTRDGGAAWTNVVANVPGLPAGTWVSSLHAGPHAAGTAFATFDGHRSGDMGVYVYRTDDHGATWTSLAGEGGEVEGYAWVVKQDPVNPGLLYLGTELGLYLSLDGGERWARFEEGLPKVAVHDLVIHPGEHDVILATHGRGIYVLDDVTPLRALTPEVLESEVTLLPSRPAVMMITSQLSAFSTGEFVGETVPEAAAIDYYLRKRHLIGELRIEVYDQEGELITTLPSGKRRGLNRVYWPMRLPPPKLPPATNLVFVFQGPRVLEGDYKVRLVKKDRQGETELEGEISLVPDPRSPHSAEDRRAQQEAALEIYESLEDLTYMVDVLTSLRDQARARAAALDRRADVSRLEAFADRLEEIRGTLVSTAEAGWLSGDEQLREELGNLFGEVVGYDGRPTQSQLSRKDVLLGELAAAETSFEGFVAGELPGLDALLERRGLEPIARQSREEWEAAQQVSGSSGQRIRS
jgi:photosystem II stability/assembly factor-like uncharacterized protein